MTTFRAMILGFDWPLLLFVSALSFAWAMMEIQIEGPRRRLGQELRRPGGSAKHPIFDYGLRRRLRLITGYDVWAFGGIFLFFHLPFVWTLKWSWAGEAHVFGAFCLFWVIEDYLWFVMNPAFGHKGLHPDKVWWHKRWILGWPTNYYVSGALGLALFLFR